MTAALGRVLLHLPGPIPLYHVIYKIITLKFITALLYTLYMSETSIIMPNPINRTQVSSGIRNSISSTSAEYSMILEETLETEKPIKVTDNSIEIDETLMEENLIYPIQYRGEQYYVKLSNGETEVFQLEE